MKLKCLHVEFDLGREVPHEQQEWREYLAVAYAGDQCYVGLLPYHDHVLEESFKLYHALVAVQPGIDVRPGSGGRSEARVVRPPMLFPYYALGALSQISIRSPSYCFLLKDQDERAKQFFGNSYQDFFVPPRIVQPETNLDPIQKPTKHLGK